MLDESHSHCLCVKRKSRGCDILSCSLQYGSVSKTLNPTLPKMLALLLDPFRWCKGQVKLESGTEKFVHMSSWNRLSSIAVCHKPDNKLKQLIQKRHLYHQLLSHNCPNLCLYFVVEQFILHQRNATELKGYDSFLCFGLSCPPSPQRSDLSRPFAIGQQCKFTSQIGFHLLGKTPADLSTNLFPLKQIDFAAEMLMLNDQTLKKPSSMFSDCTQAE